jgi:hypothetical protein
MTHFATQVTGWLFISAAIMLWIGWVLLPVHLGPFFAATDFARLYGSLRRWIWLYRMHLFGYVVTMMALVALATLLAETVARIVVWPAVAVAGAGLLVAALAAAFYYHFGAWGAVGFGDAAGDAIDAHIAALRTPTEYVTCLVRFGRVFFGLGQLVLALGLTQAALLPPWLVAGAALLGWVRWS